MAELKFPNENDSYRSARTELLNAELELRKHTERVADMRRQLPLGGAVKEDYAFDELVEGAPSTVKLSELFADDKDSLFLYGFMFGPKAERPCPMCTAFLDSLNANALHLSQRINVAVVARSPIERVRKYADARNWTNLRVLSSANNSYQSDYYAESADNGQMPMANVFVRRDGNIHHHWGTELLFATSEAGSDPRHLDGMWPLWSVFDLTPDGRGGDWYPKIKY
jgi:predicted dithiol-disulfide oxidoreductase (DUF899 family)